jgi:hypothetical protein
MSVSGTLMSTPTTTLSSKTMQRKPPTWPEADRSEAARDTGRCPGGQPAGYHDCVNATPLLTSLLATLAEAHLEAVLIGNAAAALHGAPVTTIDFDFMFRDTPTNLRKLKRVASSLSAVVLRPYYPVSKLYRMVNDDTGLQADFMPVIHGVRSFEGLKRRATSAVVGGQTVLVAALDDIIRSKKAAGRGRDLAVIPILEQTLRATRNR